MWPEQAAETAGAAIAGGQRRAGQGDGARRWRRSDCPTIHNAPSARSAWSHPRRLLDAQPVSRSWASSRQDRCTPRPLPDRDRGPSVTVLDPTYEKLTLGKRGEPGAPGRHLSGRAMAAAAPGGFSMKRSAVGKPSLPGQVATRRGSRSRLPFVNLCGATWLPKTFATVRESVEHELAKCERRSGPSAIRQATMGAPPATGRPAARGRSVERWWGRQRSARATCAGPATARWAGLGRTGRRGEASRTAFCRLWRCWGAAQAGRADAEEPAGELAAVVPVEGRQAAAPTQVACPRRVACAAHEGRGSAARSTSGHDRCGRGGRSDRPARGTDATGVRWA
jgi:hypothetical protein